MNEQQEAELKLNQERERVANANLKEAKREIDKTEGIEFPLFKKRDVTIKRRNRMLLPGQDPDEIREKIGSSLKGNSPLRGLTKEEERRWLPSYVGSDEKSMDFEIKCTDYWNSISRDVPPSGPNGLGGLKLEVGLAYEDGYDKLGNVVTAREKYSKDLIAPKDSNGVIINPAGEPINLPDYILYRYCLVYNEIANEESLVGMSPKIRFFIFTKDKDIADKKVALNKQKEAFTIYQQNIGDRNWVDHMLRLFLVRDQDSANPISNIMVKDLPTIDPDEKDVILADYQIKDPESFIKFGKDKDLALKGFIEQCIASGILDRIPNTSTITFEGNTIGHTMEEAVVFLNTPANGPTLKALKANLTVKP